MICCQQMVLRKHDQLKIIEFGSSLTGFARAAQHGGFIPPCLAKLDRSAQGEHAPNTMIALGTTDEKLRKAGTGSGVR